MDGRCSKGARRLELLSAKEFRARVKKPSLGAVSAALETAILVVN